MIGFEVEVDTVMVELPNNRTRFETVQRTGMGKKFGGENVTR